MENLGSRRRLDDRHIVIRAQLQIAFKSCGRMFRPLPFIPVRQEHDQSANTSPFRLTRTDELVDHDLCTVGEIPELAFPQGQRIRRRRRKTVFERQRRFFRQWRIDDRKAGLIFRDVLQGHIFSRPGNDPFLIVQDSVSVNERAAFRILTRQPDRKTG